MAAIDVMYALTLSPHDRATALPLIPYSKDKHHAAITAGNSPIQMRQVSWSIGMSVRESVSHKQYHYTEMLAGQSRI